MDMYAVGRMSHHKPTMLRLAIDPGEQTGTTAVPLLFPTEEAAQGECVSRGKEFFVIPVSTEHIPAVTPTLKV